MPKRKRKTRVATVPEKRQKTEKSAPNSARKVLEHYYPNVLSLRRYLVARLAQSSKKRRRYVDQYGLAEVEDGCELTVKATSDLLDSVLVGCFDFDGVAVTSCRLEKELEVFTQQMAESAVGTTLTQGALTQSEIVDFTIWLLFRKHNTSHRPPHLLCHGFQRFTGGGRDGHEVVVTGIPGILSSCTNPNVERLKRQAWSTLPSVLGKAGEGILSNMLMECGVFVPVHGDGGNLTQLSGTPLCDLKANPKKPDPETGIGDRLPLVRVIDTAVNCARGFSDIKFVRHWMLYARPTLNAKGKIRFGLNQVHVLNRCARVGSAEETVHVMKHIFPRQFGLHNVFTSDVNLKDTTQPFKDYTIRDQEIARVTLRHQQKRSRTEEQALRPPSLPKRLRGQTLDLVRKLRRRHAHCAYARLLEHYCPPPSAQASNAAANFMSLATPAAQVSAFCRAAVSRVFPDSFWSADSDENANQAVLLRAIEAFIQLRRYESMSIHDVLQGIKISSIGWLSSPKQGDDSKLSRSDFAKRQEIVAELVYYLFDSFIIPLIRSNFHVTESGVHRNQLFFFRHDVWKAMAEPSLTSLKNTMLQELSAKDVKQLFAKRALGFSQVRLLPKEQGMRPIINLRRRVQKQVHGHTVLGRSINSILTPAFSILNYEKESRPGRLGSALFSVDDLFPRLQAFRSSLQQQGKAGARLYFAKVDVQSCFDTIPQSRLLQLVDALFSSEMYHTARYARTKLIGGNDGQTAGFPAKPSWKFLSKADAASRGFDFGREVESDTAQGRTRTVYVDSVVQKTQSRGQIIDLLKEHVETNLIKLGKRFYRQKEGIPQGSIVSSLLCSYFYAELERNHLAFLDDGQSILLRLIDDFLVISTSREVVERFLRVMHAGIPEFGVKVKTEKSLANFDISIGGLQIKQLPPITEFPYCGKAINTVTLDISKDEARRRKSNIADSMTVEYSKLPGQAFHRKTLNALKLQMQAMLLSTNYNSFSSVLSNLHLAFAEVAQKSFHYIRSLPVSKQPIDGLVISTYLSHSLKRSNVVGLWTPLGAQSTPGFPPHRADSCTKLISARKVWRLQRSDRHSAPIFDRLAVVYPSRRVDLPAISRS